MNPLFAFIGAVVAFSIVYLYTVRTHVPSHARGHSDPGHIGGLVHRKRKEPCTVLNQCRCRATEDNCMCAMGTKLGPDCLSTACSWKKQSLEGFKKGTLRHEKGHLSGTCHQCSSDECDACHSEEDCNTPGGCQWKNGRCKDRCSLKNCKGCQSKGSCSGPVLADFTEKCSWDSGASQCSGRCHSSQCNRCYGSSECESTEGCAWDTSLNTCVKQCLTGKKYAALGLGCWTCATKFLCTHSENAKSQSNPGGCSWSESNYECFGLDPDEKSPYFGNVVNPTSSLFRVDSLSGDLTITKADSEVADVQVVYGNLNIYGLKEAETLVLAGITYIHGNIVVRDNPKLKHIEFNTELKVGGFYDLSNNFNDNSELRTTFEKLKIKSLSQL